MGKVLFFKLLQSSWGIPPALRIFTNLFSKAFHASDDWFSDSRFIFLNTYCLQSACCNLFRLSSTKQEGKILDFTKIKTILNTQERL